MILILARRHHGVHTTVKEISIEGRFEDFVTYETPVGGRQLNPVVDEDLLLERLPQAELPHEPKLVLLLVEDPGSRRYSGTSTAVGEPKRFRRWGKYFDAYSLALTRRMD